MELINFQTLLTPAGQEVLHAAVELHPTESNFLHDFDALSRRYPPDLARAALEIAILRQEAEVKFPLAEHMYFTRQALEQASSYEVSNYRAGRFRDYDLLADLGCSIGGDTLTLATIAPTVAVDHDLLRLAMCRANLEASGLGDRVFCIQADLTQGILLSPVTGRLSLFANRSSPSLAIFFDPARRLGRQRAFSVANYHPPLSVIAGWLPYFPALGVKISPGVELAELASYDAEIEFISLRGELKEAVLWFGPLRTCARRATCLPGLHSLASLEIDLSELRGTEPISEPLGFLYEPDASILRAGLVSRLAAELGACQLDPDIAYLTADRYVPSPFARAWQVEAWFPFGLKRLRAALRERHVGKVIVKKRGSPLQPEALIHDLRLKGDEERTIFLTHLRSKPIVVLCYPHALKIGR